MRPLAREIGVLFGKIPPRRQGTRSAVAPASHDSHFSLHPFEVRQALRAAPNTFAGLKQQYIAGFQFAESDIAARGCQELVVGGGCHREAVPRGQFPSLYMFAGSPGRRGYAIGKAAGPGCRSTAPIRCALVGGDQEGLRMLGELLNG